MGLIFDRYRTIQGLPARPAVLAVGFVGPPVANREHDRRLLDYSLRLSLCRNSLDVVRPVREFGAPQ